MTKVQQMLVSGLAIILGASVANAEELSTRNDLCLARLYSESHLAKNPQQKVATMQLVHRPSQYSADQMRMAQENFSQYGPNFSLTMTVRFVDSALRYDQWMICREDDAGYRCGVECDGGYFKLRFKANGSALVDFRNTHGMLLNSSCGEGVDHRWIGDGSSDDMLFRLDPAPLAACQ